MANPKGFVDITLEAESLGFESIWLPEHLVLPMVMGGSPTPGDDHPPVPPTTPVFDAFAYLAYLAGRTERIRLGTHVYNLALRHPFVAARAVTTLDIVSGGRAVTGIGAGWLAEEWEAAGFDFGSRGRRLDEAVAVCKELWTQPAVEHHGEFFDFDAVAFEPKPIQAPYPPILVGGESDAALRRAARLGEGWIGMAHTPDTAATSVGRLRELLGEAGRDPHDFEVCVGGTIASSDDVDAFAAAGVTRLVISPWSRSLEAVDGMRRFAELVGLA